MATSGIAKEAQLEIRRSRNEREVYFEYRSKESYTRKEKKNKEKTQLFNVIPPNLVSNQL